MSQDTNLPGSSGLEALPAGGSYVEAPPPYDATDEEGGIDLRRYLATLLRYKWLILGLGLLGFAGGAWVSKLVKPVYEAQVTLQIEVTPRGGAQTGPIRNTAILESRGWVDLLKSYTVLDEVVRRRRLFVEYDKPDEARFFEQFEVGEKFTPGRYRLKVTGQGDRVALTTDDGTILEERAITDTLGASLGFKWTPQGLRPGQELSFFVRTPRDAASLLFRSLNVPPMPVDAAFMRIEMRGTDPAGIASTLNVLADRYVEVATFLKKDKLTQVTQVLRAQLDRSQTDLRNAENALETFKVNTITLPADRGATPITPGLQDTRDPVRMAFFGLRLSRDSLSMEREAVLRALQMREDSTNSLVVTLGTIPSVAASPELSSALALLASKRAEARQLRLTFGPAHPPLVQLDREIAQLAATTIPTQARAVAANLQLRISDLDERIAASGREMQQIPARVSEEARRERNVAIASNLYTQLQAAYEQANLAELSASPDVRVLDPATVPTRPVTDRLLFLIAGGLFAGLALGVGLALLLDKLDHRIRYPEQVTRDLGLTILGALPMMRFDRQGKPRHEDAANLLEAMRSIRMNLTYAHGTAGTFVTTITSPGAGDGKSFVSMNLARTFVTAGRRTLLIDADSRRGVLHRAMGVDRKPGLLDYLSGSASREEIIRPIADSGIDFIPCGTRMAGGPELLSSSQMAQFLMALRSEYQAIIIDSPPIGAGVDPLVLASLCGSLVMVLRTGVTDRELAETRLADLQRLPIRVLGAILNDVKPEGTYRYYSYLPGYRSEDEGGAEEEPVTKGGRKKLLGVVR